MTWADRSNNGETKRINAEYIRLLDDMAEVESDVESNTLSNLEKKESSTLRDIEKSMRESLELVKTLGYCTIAGIAVWQLLCKTKEHINKSTTPVSTASTTSVPATSAARTAMSTTPVSNSQDQRR